MRCASATSLPLFVLITSVLLCQPGVFAEPAAAVFTADVSAALGVALGTLDATILDDDWSFTTEVVEEDELRVIHSDPRRSKYEKRQLLSVNGTAQSSNRKSHQVMAGRTQAGEAPVRTPPAGISSQVVSHHYGGAR